MSKAIRIVIITASLSAGGAERVISQLLKEWEKQNCELSLILLNKRDKFYAVPESVNICEIGKISNNRIIDKLKRYKRVKELVKAIKPDIILSMPEEIGIYVLWALRHVKIPIVVSERNNPYVMPNKKITRFMRKIYYPTASGLIFQTEQAASFFSDKIRKKGIVLNNPLDLSRIPNRWDGEREKVIVSAGRLEPQKNFLLLIEAFSEFYKSHKDFKLIIYGNGGERARLEDLIVARGLKDNVLLPGVSNDLLNEIRRASMFVLSSDYEGVPNALIEAMAVGLPCVSTDCDPGGAASIIDDGKNGILVPKGDVVGLTEAITELADNSKMAKEFSVASLNVKNKYDSCKVGLDWLDYLTLITGAYGKHI